MLEKFIVANRSAIIARAQQSVASRTQPKATEEELKNGIPVFLDQLGDALVLAKSSDSVAHEQLGLTAGRHGLDLFRSGVTIAQVVHDYGDVCQAITELAVKQHAPIPAADFRTLNLCLDDAIAGAVTAYALLEQNAVAAQGTERLGILAHELRNLLNTAMLSFESIKSGRVAPGGSTGQVHTRSLMGLRDLIDRSLADVRLDAGIAHIERFGVAAFLEELEIGALIQARARMHSLVVTSVPSDVAIEGDRQSLAAAISNLLQNAFKFTRNPGTIHLTARVAGDRVLFDIEDECGGLPPGKVDGLFKPFEQRDKDRSGIGLGLSICLKAAKANGGTIHVRDLPGKGCVFTLDLPRQLRAPETGTEANRG